MLPCACGRIRRRAKIDQVTENPLPITPDVHWRVASRFSSAAVHQFRKGTWPRRGHSPERIGPGAQSAGAQRGLPPPRAGIAGTGTTLRGRNRALSCRAGSRWYSSLVLTTNKLQCRPLAISTFGIDVRCSTDEGPDRVRRRSHARLGAGRPGRRESQTPGPVLRTPFQPAGSGEKGTGRACQRPHRNLTLSRGRFPFCPTESAHVQQETLACAGHRRLLARPRSCPARL